MFSIVLLLLFLFLHTPIFVHPPPPLLPASFGTCLGFVDLQTREIWAWNFGVCAAASATAAAAVAIAPTTVAAATTQGDAMAGISRAGFFS